MAAGGGIVQGLDVVTGLPVAIRERGGALLADPSSNDTATVQELLAELILEVRKLRIGLCSADDSVCRDVSDAEVAAAFEE